MDDSPIAITKRGDCMNEHTVFRTTHTQIGKTLYIVKTLPSERATETAEQKLVRFVAGCMVDDLKNAGKSGNAMKTA